MRMPFRNLLACAPVRGLGFMKVGRTAGRPSGPWGSHHAHALRELAGARPVAHHPAHTLHALHAVRARTGAWFAYAARGSRTREQAGSTNTQCGHQSFWAPVLNRCQGSARASYGDRARMGWRGRHKLMQGQGYARGLLLGLEHRHTHLLCFAERAACCRQRRYGNVAESAHLRAKHSWKGQVLRQSACAHQHRGLQTCERPRVGAEQTAEGAPG